MYRNMADYDDIGRGGVSWSCIWLCCVGLCSTLANALYSCFCACWSLCKSCCGEPVPQEKVRVSVVDYDIRRPVSTMLMRQCFDYVTTEPWTTADEFELLASKVVWVAKYQEQQRGILTEEFDSVLDYCKREAKDILLIYADVPIQYSCPWGKVFNRDLNIATDQRIADLIVRNRFFSVTSQYDMNKKQREIVMQWVKEIHYKNLSIVGFSTKTRELVTKMMQENFVLSNLQKVHLSKDADFKPEELHRKVLLLCSYTERNNIMVERPDVGELTGVYEVVQERNVDVIVMYAGVPTHYPPCPSDQLFSPHFRKLLKSQPRLRELMDSRCFMTVDTYYKLNQSQKQRISEWLAPSRQPRPQRADIGYSSYGGV